MSLQHLIKRLFKIVYILGILPAEYSKKDNKLIITKGHEKYMFRLTIVTVVFFEAFFVFVCVSSFSNALDVYYESRTGNMLVLLQLLESVLIQLVLTTAFYKFRYKHVDIFNRILKCVAKNSNAKSNEVIKKRIFNQAVLNGVLIVIFIGNITLLGTLDADFNGSMYICNVAVLGFYFIYNSIYLSSFTCLILILVELLKIFNHKINVAKSGMEVKEILHVRNSLLTLCCNDIKKIYGLSIMLQSGFCLTSISAFFFLTFVAYEWFWQHLMLVLHVFVQISLYSLPPLIMYMTALCANNIDVEVIAF